MLPIIAEAHIISARVCSRQPFNGIQFVRARFSGIDVESFASIKVSISHLAQINACLFFYIFDVRFLCFSSVCREFFASSCFCNFPES